MVRTWTSLAALAAAALCAFAPATAQVRVIVDGRLHEVPDGVVRIISYRPGGVQTIRDKPFHGAVTTGAATITTEETTEVDGRGRPLNTWVVTRIEPIHVAANVARAILPHSSPAAPPNSGVAHLDVQPGPPLSLGQERAAPGPLRIGRDPTTGHFIIPIRINGIVVRAIVDTGAANTVLSARDARATGADGAIVDTQAMVGIGGYTMLNVARVRSLEIAGQDLGGLSTPIGQDGLGFTLLGQSEIARLWRIVIEDGTMTIIPRGPERPLASLSTSGRSGS